MNKIFTTTSALYKYLLCCFVSICSAISLPLMAQTEDKYYESDESIDTMAQISPNTQAKMPKERNLRGLILGADYQFGLGNSIFIDFSPYVGYKFYDRLSVNLGIPYMYYYHLTYKESSHVLGLRGFVRLRPIVEGFGRSVFLHAEAEYLNCYMAYTTSTGGQFSQNRHIKEGVSGLNVGIGYCSNFSKGFSATLLLLYNLHYDNSHPIYNSAFIARIGFMYAF